MSIEMLAAHPSPPEGNEPLVGMQWDTNTCFAASQIVTDLGLTLCG